MNNHIILPKFKWLNLYRKKKMLGAGIKRLTFHFIVFGTNFWQKT